MKKVYRAPVMDFKAMLQFDVLLLSGDAYENDPWSQGFTEGDEL